MEISGDTMRGIKWDNCTFLGWDDMCIFFGPQEEMQFVSCYQEAKETKVFGTILVGSAGSRMVTSGSVVRPRFMMNTKAGVDFSPWQTREAGATRYTTAGVYNPSGGFDDDQLEQYFNTFVGPRLRSSEQGWRVLSWADESLMQVADNGLVSFPKGGIVLASATNTQLLDKTDAINMKGKFYTKLVMNMSNNKLYYANGSSATSIWRDVNAGPTITPV